MYLKFIKDHPIGIKAGVHCYNNGPKAGDYVTDGYAEEITQEEFIAYFVIKTKKDITVKETPKKKKESTKKKK